MLFKYYHAEKLHRCYVSAAHLPRVGKKCLQPSPALEHLNIYMIL